MNDVSDATAIQGHNEKAAAMWSSGGRAYDEVSRSIADGIEHCVLRLAPEHGERVLDVATGTGWTSRRVAARGASVTGVDIAEGLLDAARAIAAEENIEIDYHLGDAERLPFADGAFDAVISTFGVMFASDQEAAIGELARVCRSGGRLAIAAWLPDSNAVEMRKVMVPFMPGSTAAPPPSPFNWGDAAWLRTTLGDRFELGFEEGVAVQRLPSAAAMWEFMENGFGPVTALARSLDGDRRKALRGALIEWLDDFRSDLGVAVPFRYLVTVGRRR